MKNFSKKVCIFGSTGSIGCNSLKVIDNLNSNGCEIKISYLSTNTRIDELASQIEKYSPESVVIYDKKAYIDFKSRYHFANLELLCGKEGILEIAYRNDHDTLINALVGYSGLEPTIEAIKSGKQIALANKETLVIAGKLITDLIKKHDIALLPIDSEHSAILQCLIGEDRASVSRIFLTASGGPFLNKSVDEIRNTSIEEALNHPNWKMGNKITIDSATMMNKGFEVIEAKWLFDLPPDNIDVLIHPQSIIHSMVEFIDGSLKAQLGIPDMKIPIQYAITYPERIASGYGKIDFHKFGELTFKKPDLYKFKCLKLAYEVLRTGGTCSVVLNAANELAVQLFLSGRIKFLDIPDLIEDQLNKHNNLAEFTLDEISFIDSSVRDRILTEYHLENAI